MESEEGRGEAASGNAQGAKKPKGAGICIDSSRIQTSSKRAVTFHALGDHVPSEEIILSSLS